MRRFKRKEVSRPTVKEGLKDSHETELRYSIGQPSSRVKQEKNPFGC